MILRSRKAKLISWLTNTFSTTQIVVIGFFSLILVGGILLSLPISAREGIHTPFIDGLFTATSATCVTGLVVKDTYSYWSLFGQSVIIILIQIGGLGVMTIATLISFAIGRKISLKERLLMVQSYNQNEIQGIVALTKKVIAATLMFEGVAAAVLSITLIPEYGLWMGIYKSIFFSISSFCNAGFDLFGDRGQFTSLTTFKDNYILLYTSMSLIFIGGLGFNVWMDIFHYKKRKALRIHTKIALIATFALLIFGAIIIGGSEWNNPDTMQNWSIGEKIANSLFHSVTPRTAGINSIPLDSMTSVSKFVTMLLMFIGGSPGSTAGGIKTVTVAVVIMGMMSVINGSKNINVFKKRISSDVFINAVAITMIAIFVLLLSILVLCAYENFNFMEISYEAVSAFGTVGLSLGITPMLKSFSKLILMGLMFFGRVGVLTMTFAIFAKMKNASSVLEYPEEKVMIG